MTPVAMDVINIIQSPLYWQQVEQLIKTVKPIVDAIGNLESREANLADCMLELIRCARHMYQVTVDDGDDITFLNHAKLTFNREFHSMNTDLHALALFLHPTCRNLAVSQVANGRTFEFMCKVALSLVQQWGWSGPDAAKVIDDMKLYYQRQAPFTGQERDSLAWWKALPISGKLRPLKALAIVVFSIVPHAGDVERLFSDLGGIQGTRRNLTVSLSDYSLILADFKVLVVVTSLSQRSKRLVSFARTIRGTCMIGPKPLASLYAAVMLTCTHAVLRASTVTLPKTSRGHFHGSHLLQRLVQTLMHWKDPRRLQWRTLTEHLRNWTAGRRAQ